MNGKHVLAGLGVLVVGSLPFLRNCDSIDINAAVQKRLKEGYNFESKNHNYSPHYSGDINTIGSWADVRIRLSSLNVKKDDSSVGKPPIQVLYDEIKSSWENSDGQWPKNIGNNLGELIERYNSSRGRSKISAAADLAAYYISEEIYNPKLGEYLKTFLHEKLRWEDGVVSDSVPDSPSMAQKLLEIMRQHPELLKRADPEIRKYIGELEDIVKSSLNYKYDYARKDYFYFQDGHLIGYIDPYIQNLASNFVSDADWLKKMGWYDEFNSDGKMDNFAQYIFRNEYLGFHYWRMEAFPLKGFHYWIRGAFPLNWNNLPDDRNFLRQMHDGMYEEPALLANLMQFNGISQEQAGNFLKDLETLQRYWIDNIGKLDPASKYYDTFRLSPLANVMQSLMEKGMNDARINAMAMRYPFLFLPKIYRR